MQDPGSPRDTGSPGPTRDPTGRLPARSPPRLSTCGFKTEGPVLSGVCPAIFLKLTPRIPLPQALSPQGPQCPSAVLSRLCWKFPRQAGHRLNNQLFPLLPEQRSLPSTWSDPSSPFTAGLLSIHAAPPPESQCLLFLHSLLLFSLHPTQLSR